MSWFGWLRRLRTPCRPLLDDPAVRDALTANDRADSANRRALGDLKEATAVLGLTTTVNRRTVEALVERQRQRMHAHDA